MTLFRRAFACFLALGLLSTLTFAQSDADRAAKSSQIIDKVRQLDLLNHILPIIFTKEQLNDLIPAVEKARQNVKKTEMGEADLLLKVDGDIQKELDKAIEEGNMPGRKTINEINNMFAVMQESRLVVGKDNEDLVYNVLKTECNEGQKKAMSNTLDPHTINPDLHADKMTEEEKIRFYIRNTLLDPLAYPLLVKLSRSPATPSK